MVVKRLEQDMVVRWRFMVVDSGAQSRHRWWIKGLSNMEGGRMTRFSVWRYLMVGGGRGMTRFGPKVLRGGDNKCE